MKADYDMLNYELIESVKLNTLKDKKIDSLLTLVNKNDVVTEMPKKQIRTVITKSKLDTTISKEDIDSLK
jgi:hypothetical protein